MNILVIGSGGREHAIAKKFKQSKEVEHVYCAPGNIGMKEDQIELVDIKELDFENLIQFAKEHVDWTFVGPEIPLFNGIVDAFEEKELKIFGPNKKAAQIETSKVFAKKLMKEYNIPTAEYEVFTDYQEAYDYIHSHSLPIVLKADGLASGKGVTVAETLSEADRALKDIFDGRYANEKDPIVVIEEFLLGEEFSFFSFIYEDQVHHMIPAQDHKRAYENDKGPNTGGMGAYTPLSFINEDIYSEVIESIVEPTLKAMKDKNCPFNGVLFTGVILTEDGPKVIEYNARLGDPETQVILPMLKSNFAKSINQMLLQKPTQFEWEKNQVCLGVVVAADGYPFAPVKDIPVDLSPRTKELSILYSGVKGESTNGLLSKGGRIFMVVAKSSDFKTGKRLIYNYLKNQALTNMFYRLDIGRKT